MIAAAIMLAFGLWWLGRAEAVACRKGEGYGAASSVSVDAVAEDATLRQRATTAREFDPPEVHHGRPSAEVPPIAVAALPLLVVVSVNVMMSLAVLPRLDVSFLAEERFGATSLSAVGGVWAVVTALMAAIIAVIAVNRARLPALRETMDAGATASVLPVLSVASLVGFGAVVAAVPAFAIVRDWVLGVGGGPLVSLAVATNVLSCSARHLALSEFANPVPTMLLFIVQPIGGCFSTYKGKGSHDIQEMDRRCGAGIARSLRTACRDGSEFRRRHHGRLGQPLHCGAR